MDGSCDDCAVGLILGSADWLGLDDGFMLGMLDGSSECSCDGFKDGLVLGNADSDGSSDGYKEGIEDGSTDDIADGPSDGCRLCSSDGFDEGVSDGSMLGPPLGIKDNVGDDDGSTEG